MALRRLVFIRSGETEWNYAGRWQGWVAVPLNEHGRKQMARLANFIRHIGMTRLYSSDHRRARESAEIICAELGYDPIYDDRLRERSIGVFQGLTVPEIHGWYPEEYKQLLADPEYYVIPGGESVAQVRQRAGEALDAIIKQADESQRDETIGILSHTTTIRLMLSRLMPDKDRGDLQFGNSSVTTVMRESGRWRITAENDQMHLEGLESRVMPQDVYGDDKE